MSEEIEVFNKLAEAEQSPDIGLLFGTDDEQSLKISEHKSWLREIRHERPNPAKSFRVGIYIRYFNQTKHDNYLEYHIKQYQDTLNLCPNWELVDFYIDEGSTAPNMESAPEWCRLLNDCLNGKVNLIITQLVANVSKKPYEISFIARYLAAMKEPVGIYFVSEDIFTLASYYQHDLTDDRMFPDESWETLPDDENESKGFLIGGESE